MKKLFLPMLLFISACSSSPSPSVSPLPDKKCVNHTEITQKVERYSFIKDTYFVQTLVCVKDCQNNTITVEFINSDVVKFDKTDSLKNIQKLRADSCDNKLKLLINK